VEESDAAQLHDAYPSVHHDLVWSTPMSTLAKDFGISDVALAKRCCAADVPVPAARLLGPPGRWATPPNQSLIHPTRPGRIVPLGLESAPVQYVLGCYGGMGNAGEHPNGNDQGDSERTLSRSR